MPHSLSLLPPPFPMALPPPFLLSANLVKLSPRCPPKCIWPPVHPTVTMSVFVCLWVGWNQKANVFLLWCMYVKQLCCLNEWDIMYVCKVVCMYSSLWYVCCVCGLLQWLLFLSYHRKRLCGGLWDRHQGCKLTGRCYQYRGFHQHVSNPFPQNTGSYYDLT